MGQMSDYKYQDAENYIKYLGSDRRDANGNRRENNHLHRDENQCLEYIGIKDLDFQIKDDCQDETHSY